MPTRRVHEEENTQPITPPHCVTVKLVLKRTTLALHRNQATADRTMIKRRTTDAAVAATPTTALERCRHSCCLVAVLLSSWSLTNTYGFSVGHAPLHRSLNPDVREGGKVVLLRHGIRRSRGVGLAPIGMGLLAVNRRRSSGAEPGGGGGLSSTDARAALGSRDWKNLSAEVRNTAVRGEVLPLHYMIYAVDPEKASSLNDACARDATLMVHVPVDTFRRNNSVRILHRNIFCTVLRSF